MNNPFDVLIDSYLENKIGIDDSFLTEALSNGLQQNIRQLQKDEQLMKAGIGNDEVKDSKQQIRSDSIYWIDKKHDNIFVLNGFFFYSKPGHIRSITIDQLRRDYYKKNKLLILSTIDGICTSREALQKNQGGIILAEIGK